MKLSTVLRRHLSPSAPGASAAEPPAGRGHVEGLSGLVLRGWALAPGGELLQLRSQERLLDVTVTRLEREDVRQATGSERLHLGWEIELPGRLWADGAASLSLQVLLNGQPLGQPLALDWSAVLAELAQLQAQAEAAQAAPEARSEWQYRLLQVLEHVAVGGRLRPLAPAPAAFLSDQAARFGLSALLPVAEGGTVPADNLPHDHATVTVWRLLREFNEAVGATPGEPAACLAALLARRPVRGEVRERFLHSVLPWFCGQGAYPALRPWLDAARLRALASSTNAWELSLALVESVHGSDHWGAIKILKRLGTAQGWLNTECIAETARCLAARWSADGEPAPLPPRLPRSRPDAAQPDEADEADDGLATGLTELTDALLAFLRGQGDDYWRRGHDLHLIDALVSLLAAETALPGVQAYQARRLALRLHALTPAFWQRLAVALPDPGRWPLPLRDAHQAFAAMRQALSAADALDAPALQRLLPLLGPARAARNADADLFLREILQAWVSREPTADGEAMRAALAGLSVSDPLRLAAHPLARADLLGDPQDLCERIRTVSGVAHPPARAALLARVASLRGGAPVSADPAARLGVQADLRRLSGGSNHHVGAVLAALDWCQRLPSLSADAAEDELAFVRECWFVGYNASVAHAVPPQPLLGAWCQLSRARSSPGGALPALARLLGEWAHCLEGRWRGATAAASTPADAAASWRGDARMPTTLVAIYSCRRNLDSRVRLIRETWARDLSALGVPWVVVVGDPAAPGDGRLDGDLLTLPVSDAYEHLPDKTLALVRWAALHTDADHLLKIDDDCHFAAERFFAQSTHLGQHYLGRRLHRAIGGTDRAWHQDRSATELAAGAIDKSPEPSIYADGGAGYCLSRYAMHSLLQVLASGAGARLTRSAYMEDKLLGDLLARAGVSLSSEGHETLVRRRFGPGAVPVNAYQNIFLPGPCSPTVVAHLDDATQLPAVQAALAEPALRPARVWPSHVAPRLGGPEGSNQLELLSPEAGVRALRDAPALVVAVARNEAVLMPHFLAHYRGLGVRHFVLVDNLSDDGTREYLLQQPDVVLYSADTEYRQSHFGVSWQQAVLGAHALGKWVVLADIDEFLVYPGSDSGRPLTDWLAEVGGQGDEAVLTMMVDMYPEGPLDQADFSRAAPFDAAPCHDARPLLRWHLGSGCFSNGGTWLSALRHRLIADSAPNLYTSQKIAVLRYQPWVRLSEGLHYAANLRVAEQPAAFAHFKYHAGFRRKVLAEIARKQHFNGAEEYRKYLAMLAEAAASLAQPGASVRWSGSAALLAAAGR